MALDRNQEYFPTSLPTSGRSSPAPRAARQTVEDGIYKADKTLRKYGATIERALTSWEISPQEWADYIAFLARLLKAIQTHPKDPRLLPHSDDIAYKLAQCLNPALPSGVHQKALEVYDYVFSTFGRTWIAGHLNDFLPGLTAVLSFASLSVRPSLYSLLEDYVVHLSPLDLRPALKPLILSLLPALEEEASEDFERGFSILEKLEHGFSPTSTDSLSLEGADKDGYFWQCLFLAVITSPTKRQGALNFLVQKLPSFHTSITTSTDEDHAAVNGNTGKLSLAAEVVISPEPGLLIRCFICGLSDSQLLIQRGYLDLLVNNIPLHSPLLQHRIGNNDLDHLVSAGMHVLLRREMSLNRRLWSWFLGPGPKPSEANDTSSSPTVDWKRSADSLEDWHAKYFAIHGKATLERCVLTMFKQTATYPTEKARPFRICLSLMDRWEIGGSIVPHMFLPAMESAYQYSGISSATDTTEVLRSASLFFDGIEASLIWANLIGLLRAAFTEGNKRDKLEMFRWIVHHFNVKDEDMLTTHIPYAAIYLLTLLASDQRAVAVDTRLAAIDTVSLLLDMVPERAFRPPNSKTGVGFSNSPTPSDPKTVRKSLDLFYDVLESSPEKDMPLRGQALSETIFSLSISLLLEALDEKASTEFAEMVSILLALQSKTSTLAMFEKAGVLQSIFATVDRSLNEEQTIAFPTISAILSLLSISEPNQQGHTISNAVDISKLGPLLCEQIWQYLSPLVPKYHVEAVKAVWQLHELAGAGDCIESSLTALMRGVTNDDVEQRGGRPESVRRFVVLWDHTIPIPAFSGPKHSPRGLIRRGSAMPGISDSKQALGRQKVLTEPLMIALDLLDDPEERCADVVKNWLQNLLTLDIVLNTHFETMSKLVNTIKHSDKSDQTPLNRLRGESLRELDYIVGHMRSILRHAKDWTWQCLTEMHTTAARTTDTTSGIIILAGYCCQFLCDDVFASRFLSQKAVDLLYILLSSPSATSLKILELDSRFMNLVTSILSDDRVNLQGRLLDLVAMALKLRATGEPDRSSTEARPASSSSVKRSSMGVSRPSPNTSSSALISSTPSQLTNFLQLGFSSPSSRPYLDQWIGLLSNILPAFSDAIFPSLIPLVECLCTELDKAHNELIATTTIKYGGTSVAPEATIMRLIDALELILARAHECLRDELNVESAVKTTVQPRSLLGNVTSGVFKTEGPPSKTTQANSRLTVVLAFQDAIKVSSRLWTWANQYSSTVDFDKMSAATSSYNALRVRNRTRYLLDQLFASEPLDSLEVVISSWWYSADATQASAALQLLHVIQGLRPKNTIPAILDALCSRTSPSTLPTTRQSCQTTDLTALEIAMFLSAYLHSTEDDAMDEIWTDCMVFFRDVLSNPLPYRQVLPALLSTILLLAQKVDNTNFGEQRKMRRDLGDSFLRMLTATFTAMPAGTLEMQSSTSSNVPNTIGDERSISLVGVLKRVVENIDVILESSDRIASAVNTIAGSLINPLFHAKAFPRNVTSDALTLLLQISKKAPSAKSWRKEILDAFNDARLLMSPADLMEKEWFPVFRQWCLLDKERMPELLSRLIAPSSAGIMFGVGASVARLEADRKAQLNLRRLCLLLLACPEDTSATVIGVIEEKLVELFDASPSSSPSSAVKAELFMVCRALILSTSGLLLAPFWPIINANLQSALVSILPNSPNVDSFNNLSLLQCCKLLDLLVAVSPDEFQLHEWLYITDTTDAVYQPSQWAPAALSDQIAGALISEGPEEVKTPVTPTAFPSHAAGRRRPLLDNSKLSDKEDIKALARDDFARIILKPFLGQLSLHAYEGVYSIDTADLPVCRRNLLEDLLDLTTIVE